MGSTVAEKKPAPRRQHSDLEVDAALRAWLFCSGNKRKASELLHAQGFQIAAATLYEWATNTKRDKLEVLRKEVEPQIKAQMAEVHQGLASAAAGIEAEAIERLREKLKADQIEPKDLSAVMQRAGIVTGIHADKHLLYSGQPTSIVGHNTRDVLRALKAKGIDVEVVDAEVVEETDA